MKGLVMTKRLALSLTVLFVLSAGSPGLAQANNPCTFSGGVVTATLPGGKFENILVNTSDDSLYLQAGPIQDPCDGATNSNTTAIHVIGSPNLDRFFLTTEGTNALNSSLVYDIDLAGSKKDELLIKATGGDDVVTFGRQSTATGLIHAVDIDSDGVKDVDLRGTERGTVVDGGGGNDRFSGNPGGALSPSRLELTMNGGNKNDRLTGGNGKDFLIGSSGKDRIAAGRGDDMLSGGPQKDVVNGGPGNDRCFAVAGDRVISCERRRD
jgi:Ca2+-binding RTX toxin-like protein